MKLDLSRAGSGCYLIGGNTPELSRTIVFLKYTVIYWLDDQIENESEATCSSVQITLISLSFLMKVFDFRMLVCTCGMEYPSRTRLNIFGKSIFDVPGELREVGVVIMKKETEGSFVCKAMYYGELAEHKSHREKLQQIK